MKEVDVDRELPFAVSWTLREPTARSSHALASGGLVWLIDPLVNDEALAAAEGLGEIASVLQLLDRHNRDCAELADRYGVPHLRLPESVDDAPFVIREVVSVPRWHELGLWWEAESLLLVPEAIGSGPYFAVAGGPLGVHPFLRLWPPRSLGELAPSRLLLGHGPPIHEHASAALAEALARSRRDAPRAALAMLRSGSGG